MSPKPAAARSTIEKVLLEQSNSSAFETVPTHRPNVALLAEPGQELVMDKRAIAFAATNALAYVKTLDESRRVKKQLGERGANIKAIPEEYPSFRGIVLQGVDRRIAVYPQHTKDWDLPHLQEVLGAAASTVIHEDLVEHISVPSGIMTSEGPLTANILHKLITETLIERGVPKEDIKKIQLPELVPRVDEKKLATMVLKGQVKLPEDVARVETTLAIKVTSSKNPKIRTKRRS